MLANYVVECELAGLRGLRGLRGLKGLMGLREGRGLVNNECGA
jgi:hypothetical protein